MSAPEFPPTEGSPPRVSGRRPLWAGVMVALIAALAGAALAHGIWPGGSSPTRSAAVGGANGFGFGGYLGTLPPNPSAPSSGSSGGTATSSGSTATAASRVDPGIVDINTTLAAGNGAAAGTGMVVTSSGEVITNNHVIAAATRIQATDVGNGKTYTAHVVGYDRTHDIAVLQLEQASGLPTVPIGDSSTVRVGAAVVTLGNAGGVGGTPSAAAGTVAALDQSITASDSVDQSSERLAGLIGVDGQLRPGDSGGPLVNSSGQVVGMDTAASSSFSFQTSTGQGFAIPINDVLAVAAKIVAGQGSDSIHIGRTGLLGVLIAPGGSAGAFGFGSGPAVAGVPVEEAIAGSAAAAAGLVGGDTITGLNGHAVRSQETLITLKDRHHPGDRVRLSWVDSAGATHTATIRLSEGPPD